VRRSVPSWSEDRWASLQGVRSQRDRCYFRPSSKACATNSARFTAFVNNAGIGTKGLLATMHNSEIEGCSPHVLLVRSPNMWCGT